MNKVWGLITFLFVLISIFYNMQKTPCSENLASYTDKSFHFQITKNPNGLFNDGSDFKVFGKDLKTNKEYCYTQLSEILVQHRSKLDIGDTFYKLKNLNYCIICRKKYRLYEIWYCKSDNFYKNVLIDSFYQYNLNEIPDIDSSKSNNLDNDYQVYNHYPYSIDKNWKEIKKVKKM